MVANGCQESLAAFARAKHQKKALVCMAIQKQEFYEGAALHQVIRGSSGIQISYSTPFFIINEKLQVHLKYSTAVRSPWGFSFPPEEQQLLQTRALNLSLVIGLICGSDGIAALPYEKYERIVVPRNVAVWVSCSRLHRSHFEVSGPDATLPGKIAPSDWSRLTHTYR